MKAREIKIEMLKNYKELITSYEYDVTAVYEKRARIRIAEQDLMLYFNVELRYKFEHEK